MATLKDHQQAMVDLLASGSGIPASASRLAHAMHDLLSLVNAGATMKLDQTLNLLDVKSVIRAVEANSPGLNDKALAADVEACRRNQWQKPDVTIKPDLFDRARAAERRVKELENTVKQLREQSSKYRSTIAGMKADMDSLKALVFAYEHGAEPEQAGCRKDDTQVCDHPEGRVDTNIGFCSKCGNFL
jgi:hypothetical protein